MKVSDYYKSALAAANSTDFPSAGFFPPVSSSLLSFPLPEKWIGWTHITVKQLHFEAAAQYRLSQEDLEKSRYGEEIARLKVAEACAKKGLDTGKRGVADAVIADLRVRPSSPTTGDG
jgi:programmed cell death 6-interacting protein